MPVRIIEEREMMQRHNRTHCFPLKTVLGLLVMLAAASGFLFPVQAKTRKTNSKKSQQTVKSVRISNISGVYVMKAGSKYKLSAKVSYSGKGKKPSAPIKWHAGNTKIIRIGSTGVVEALAEGKTAVYASCSGKKSEKVKIIVGKPVSGIRIEGPGELYAGFTAELQAIVEPSDCAVSKLKWKSSDSSIATVSSTGKVKGKAAGKVVISAVSQDGHEVKGSISLKIKAIRKKDIRFVAHRGLSSMAPENTLAAFSLAGQAGFWGIECDVWETAPEVPSDPDTSRFAICHNPNVNAIYGVNRDIRSSRPSRLSSLRAKKGKNISRYPYEKLPFLEDYLAICRKYRIHPVIEIKTQQMSPESARRLVKIVRSFIPLEDVLFSSFYHGNLDEVKRAAAEYNENTGTVYIYNKRKSSPAPESLKSCYQAADRAAEKGYTYLDVSYGCLNKSFCTYADQKGVELYGSTTNTYAKLQSMVLDYNIRIMFSDWRLFQ